MFGLQRSGTTWIGEIICKSWNLQYANDDLWKHRLEPPSLFQYCPIICTIKNPYTWLESIAYREPADIARTNPIITAPGDYTIDNSYGECVINIKELMHLYSYWYNQWKDVGCIVKYEDVLASPVTLVEMFGYPEQWHVPEPGSLFMSEGYTDDMKSYYLEGKPTKLTKDQIGIVNQTLGKDIFEETGYQLCES